ncbi:YwgA family protein [Sporolactobacillus vineae]|uniref:YwgA family protein n=1 Tax=Sporolactobacillus vineae TaxID=444463 RepID=UPI0002880D65|nr:hypothetical protein [Sporolactobacillus vineae]
MLEDHAKIAAIIKQVGVVAGRKKLQKMVYILQRMGFPFREMFHFNFYGPYSDELSLQLEELCNFGFLIESRDERSTERCYRYRLSEAGESFISHYSGIIPEKDGLVDALSRETASFLELVSTLLYFDQIPASTSDDKVRALDTPYSQQDISRARHYITVLERQAQTLQFS